MAISVANRAGRDWMLRPWLRPAALALAWAAASFAASPCVAQSVAVSPPTVITTTPVAPTSTQSSGVAEMQVIPVERATRTNSRIEPVEEDYRIGNQDLLEVQVLGVQDLKREVRVNAKGLVGLPLIGSVRVSGLTTAEAEVLIAGLYRKDFLQNPEVSVFVKEFTRQSITLEGAVAKPGQYALKGPTTLLQALAIAGGQGSLSDMSVVIVFRMEDNERRAFKFDVNKIRAAEASDPLLQ